jgi:hypothetical protein
LQHLVQNFSESVRDHAPASMFCRHGAPSSITHLRAWPLMESKSPGCYGTLGGGAPLILTHPPLTHPSHVTFWTTPPGRGLLTCVSSSSRIPCHFLPRRLCGLGLMVCDRPPIHHTIHQKNNVAPLLPPLTGHSTTRSRQGRLHPNYHGRLHPNYTGSSTPQRHCAQRHRARKSAHTTPGPHRPLTARKVAPWHKSALSPSSPACSFRSSRTCIYNTSPYFADLL